jgi:hypothetical protein
VAARICCGDGQERRRQKGDDAELNVKQRGVEWAEDDPH